MTFDEVKKRIGDNRIDEFLYFMNGQTVGVSENGEIEYYIQDVENFLRNPSDRFFD